MINLNHLIWVEFINNGRVCFFIDRTNILHSKNMETFNIENLDEIDKIIIIYCKDNDLDKYHFMVELFTQLTNNIIEKECEEILEQIVDKIDLIEYEAENQLLNCVTLMIDDLDREHIFENMEESDIKEIMKFIDSKYYESWKELWDKSEDINDDEYDECLTLLFENYDMDEDTADVFVGMYLDERIK